MSVFILQSNSYKFKILGNPKFKISYKKCHFLLNLSKILFLNSNNLTFTDYYIIYYNNIKKKQIYIISVFLFHTTRTICFKIIK